MSRGNNKFLVELLGALSKKQLFFIVWAVIVGAFVVMMIAFYRKRTRSNFRSRSDGPAPYRVDVDARRLNDGSGEKKVANRQQSTPVRK